MRVHKLLQPVTKESYNNNTEALDRFKIYPLIVTEKNVIRRMVKKTSYYCQRYFYLPVLYNTFFYNIAS